MVNVFVKMATMMNKAFAFCATLIIASNVLMRQHVLSATKLSIGRSTISNALVCLIILKLKTSALNAQLDVVRVTPISPV